MQQPIDLDDPVSPERIAELKQILVEIPVRRLQLEKANRAGIDVSQQLDILLDQEQKIKQILSVYDE